MKKSLFVIISLFLGLLSSLVLAELAFKAYYAASKGTYVSVAELNDRQKNTFVQDLRKKKDCQYVDTLYPHPYVAFVHHANPPCGLDTVNSIGLFGPEFPLEKPEDTFVILVTGGSVAAHFAQMFPNGPHWLQDRLNRDFVPPRGKRFLVLNGGDGAWKQPQQTILFMLYAHAVDAVITLDGFNEHYMIDGNFRFEYPANNFFKVNPIASGGISPLLGSAIASEVQSFVDGSWLLSKSHAAHFAATHLREIIRDISIRPPGAQAKGRTSIQSMFGRPVKWPKEKNIQWSIGQYRKYIRVMDAVSKRLGVLNAHFIQPVPAIGKRLTEEEKAVVGDLGYDGIYQRMTDGVLALRGEGVPVFSLLDLFQNVNTTVYADHIHLKRTPSGESPGNMLMAKRIADDIAAAWNLKKRRGNQ